MFTKMKDKMDTSNSYHNTNTKTEDAVINGLFTGVAAGLAMILFLALVELFRNQNILTLLGSFDPSGSNSPISGTAAHLAVSAVYGLIFGLLWKLLKLGHRRIPVWLFGIFFGGVLFTIAELLILPGGDSPLLRIPVLWFGVSQLVYGFLLGFGLDRSLRKKSTGTDF
jgi:hypothetical protein